VKKTKFIIVSQILVAILLLVFSDDSISTIPQMKNGIFTIYVSNQSSSLDPVDIKISIDEKHAIMQEF
jgi:cell shape-determining protein MreC